MDGPRLLRLDPVSRQTKRRRHAVLRHPGQGGRFAHRSLPGTPQARSVRLGPGLRSAHIRRRRAAAGPAMTSYGEATEAKIQDVVDACARYGRNSVVALAGVPGTGKSHIAAIAAQRFA